MSFALSDGYAAGRALTYPDHALVHMTNVDGVVIADSRLSHAGGDAIYLGEWAHNVEISGNLIEHAAVMGVRLHGQPGCGEVVVGNHRIHNNRIRYSGQVIPTGGGVYGVNTGHNEITHNHISDAPRYGIYLKGQHFDAMGESCEGQAITWENHRDFRPTTGNLIAYNEVENVLFDSEDVGAITLMATGRDNIVDHNVMHDFASLTDGGLSHGFYGDKGSGYTTATNNIIYNMGGARAYPVVLKGVGTVFANNIVVDNRGAAHVKTRHTTPDGYNEQITAVRNIFVQDDADTIYLHKDEWIDARVLQFDYNLYFHSAGAYGVQFDDDVQESLEQWRERHGQDLNSVVGDPQFIDRAARDFRLAPDSPGHDLGFVDIDVSNVGLQEPFAWPRQ